MTNWFTGIEKRDARTRAHSQSSAKQQETHPSIFHEVLWECDASSHRFHTFKNLLTAVEATPQLSFV